MNSYRENLPLEIRKALKGLNNNNRQEILMFLLKEDEKSFIEISKALEIQKNNLSHHIKTLMRYGLIYNFYKKNDFNEKYSYYVLSNLGKKILKLLLNGNLNQNTSFILNGTSNVLPNEIIPLCINVINENVFKLILTFSDSVSLKNALNYNIKRKDSLQKIITFYTKDFEFKNNLGLLLLSEQPHEDERVCIKVEAFNDLDEKIQMEIFDINILKPDIEINLDYDTQAHSLQIELNKLDNIVGVSFEKLEISAMDVNSHKEVKVDIRKFKTEEYLSNLDIIPKIFNEKNAIKEFIIKSHEEVILKMWVNYRDKIGNEYNSNVASIQLKPYVVNMKEPATDEPIVIPKINLSGSWVQPLATVAN
ncbi:MAG: ArsR family transcriptional regulator [Candidatus Lokiarchaeota archaeon]|nr:ArsR family transcriptional regulator [Candidatus Lokiarchaeota archaeon]